MKIPDMEGHLGRPQQPTRQQRRWFRWERFVLAMYRSLIREYVQLKVENRRLRHEYEQVADRGDQMVYRDELEALRGRAAERDYWIRAFNRLEGAVAHHREKQDVFSDGYDEALWAAHDRVLKSLARKPE